jgi:hypothetical protein
MLDEANNYFLSAITVSAELQDSLRDNWGPVVGVAP